MYNSCTFVLADAGSEQCTSNTRLQTQLLCTRTHSDSPSKYLQSCCKAPQAAERHRPICSQQHVCPYVLCLGSSLSTCVCIYIYRDYVCVHAYMHEYRYASTHVCMNMYVCACICAHVFIRTRIYIYMHIYARMYVCTYVRRYVCTYWLRAYVYDGMYVRMYK